MHRFFWSSLLLLFFSACSSETDEPTGMSLSAVQGEWDGDYIFVSVDTLRADRLGMYGSSRDTAGSASQPWTPAWLAERGVTFDSAWAPIGKTLPALGTFWTGLEPLEHGGVSNKHRVIAPSRAEALQADGYLGLALVANRSLTPTCGLQKGFAGYLLRWGEQEAELAPEAVRRTESAIHAKKKMFLWAHFMAPHQPYDPPDSLRARYGGSLPAGSNALLADAHRYPEKLTAVELERLRALYDAEVHLTSTRVAQLLSGLDQNYRAAGRGGLLENARIVFFSDHGEELGDRHGYFMHAKSLYSGVIQVPLILAGPGIEQNLREETLISMADFFPLVTSGVVPARKMSFASWQGSFFAVRDTRWTLIHNPSESPTGPLEPPQDVPYLYPTVALFDRNADPLELQDISAQHPQETRRLLDALQAWWGALSFAPPGIPKGLDPAALAELGYAEDFEEEHCQPWPSEDWSP